MGSGHYVVGRQRKQPTQFVAPLPRVEGRTFTDHYGNSYEIIWPRGRMTIAQALGRDHYEEAVGAYATPE